jgi:hypothetical protein
VLRVRGALLALCSWRRSGGVESFHVSLYE